MIKHLADKYIAANFDSWHTPGHKGTLNNYDLTELMDGQYFPDNSVISAQKAVANIYGAKEIMFLTNGSSQGIKAAIMAVGAKKILASSDCHMAVDQGIELAGAQKITMQMGKFMQFNLPLTLQMVEGALKLHSDIAAVVLTSPDYFGRVVPQEIFDFVRTSGKLIIVDSAHGAHFVAHKALNAYSYASVADFCNMSAHKTLNAYTQTAYLAVNNMHYLKKVQHALTLLGTSSPSYIFLQSLYSAAAVLPTLENQYQRLKVQRDNLSKIVKLVDNQDFARLVVCAKDISAQLNGQSLAKLLFNKAIMCEMYSGDYVVFIATPNDDEQKFSRLENAFADIIKVQGNKTN